MGKRVGTIVAMGMAMAIAGGAASLAWAGAPSDPVTPDAPPSAALATAEAFPLHRSVEKEGASWAFPSSAARCAGATVRPLETVPRPTAVPTGAPAAHDDEARAEEAPSAAASGAGRNEEQAPPASETAEKPAEDGGGNDEAAGAAPGLEPGTIVAAGATIPYRDVRGGTTPDAGAGLWLGSDAVDDGSWGYFVGHNPGPFSPVRTLGPGDEVILCNNSGATRSYRVRTVFFVEATATWKTIADRVTGYGESVILQTCTGDGATNTIVVAA